MTRGDAVLGRDEELELLRAVVADVARHGGARAVIGDPGIGKSALLEAVAHGADVDGCSVLRSAAVEAETEVPFAGLHQLLRPIVGAADQLPPAQRDAISAAFGLTDEQVGDPHLVALALLTLLRDHASRHPVVLVVEDVQWLDRPSIDVLAFVARRIELDPVVMFVSSRHALAGPLGDAVADGVVLTGLERADAEALVDRYAPRLDPVMRDQLLAEAEGNPLALIELSDSWSRLPPGTLPPPWVPLTTRLQRSFASRLDELPPPTRLLVVTAALDDAPTISEILDAASLVSGARLGVADLSPAVEQRLVEADAQRVRFRHPLIRSAVHQATDVAERRTVHLALASVVDDLDRVAWHRAAAVLGVDESVAVELEAAADRANRRGAAVVAVAALERAAELTPDPAVRGHRLVRAAEFAADLGRPDVVLRLLDAAEALPVDAGDRARLAWRRQLLGGAVAGDAAQVRAVVEIVGEMEAAGDLEGAVQALIALSVAGWWTNFDDERRDLVVEAAEGLPVPESDPRLLSILGMASPIGRGAVVLERIARIRPETLDPMAACLLGSASGALGDLQRAFTLNEMAIHGLRRQGKLSNLSGALAAQSSISWMVGQWDLATAVATEAQRLAEQTERPANGGAARVFLAAVAACRGEVDVAEQIAREVEEFFRPLGSVPILDLVAFARSLVALADGRPDRAYDELASIFDRAHDEAAVAMNSCAATLYVDAAVQSGHVDDARVVMARVDHLATRSASPALRIAVEYARPRLADGGEAEAKFESALASGVSQMPFTHGRLLLAYGTWLRRRRRVNDSRAPLRTARDMFDDLGAAPWADRARQELRATGEASHDGPSDAARSLTAQELEIARLAAAGLTNREIGQQLYLSHRTVGSHLYHVFPKLGITSRNELADALDL